MGHSIGLPDYYLITQACDGLHGDAGYERMDDSIAISAVFKADVRLAQDTECSPIPETVSRFTLDDASSKGSCLILPISSQADDYTSEYFLVEYITNRAITAICTQMTAVSVSSISVRALYNRMGIPISYEDFRRNMGNDKVSRSSCKR